MLDILSSVILSYTWDLLLLRMTLPYLFVILLMDYFLFLYMWTI